MGFSATWSRLLAIVLAVPLIALCIPSQLPRPDTSPDGGPAALIGNDAVSTADDEQGGGRRAMVFRTGDGSVLPVRVWNGADPDCAKAPETPPRIVVAMHGMNDRAAAFDEIAEAWSVESCFRIYAYDQRGFGRTVNPDELWPGTDLQVEDLVDPVGVILAANQRRPITVVGESMGAAVVLLALSRHRLPTAIDGTELIAPAAIPHDALGSVVGIDALGPVLRGTAWLGAHMAPALRLGGESRIRDLSADHCATEAMLADPEYRPKVRLDALWGLVDIMDEAAAAAPDVDRPVLIVHGTEDTMVAPQVVAAAAESMPKNCAALCWVDGGRHLVTHQTPGQHVRAANCRDRKRPRQLWQTLAAWTDGTDTPTSPCHARPPSRRAIEALNACGNRNDDRL
jgi:alpha-beta hydrolase superfamily lysophospholipase